MINYKINGTYSRKSLVAEFGSESVENPPPSSNLSIDLSSDTVEIVSLLQSGWFKIHPLKRDIYIQRSYIEYWRFRAGWEGAGSIRHDEFWANFVYFACHILHLKLQFPSILSTAWKLLICWKLRPSSKFPPISVSGPIERPPQKFIQMWGGGLYCNSNTNAFPKHHDN